MARMAKKRPKPMQATKDAPTGRIGESVNFWVQPELAEALRAYLAATRPTPTKTAVFTTALELFLEQKGFWPPNG
jgi:hypothetical protein